MPRIALVAGEVSGDRLGAGLVTALRARLPGAEFAGVAGPGMVAAGCTAWAPTEALSVMGLVEVLRHLPRIRSVHAEVVRRLAAAPPAAFVGIDAPDFNLRVERRARALGIPTVHYVSPSVWAWREGRVATLRASCDLVLCLLPFEADFLNARGVAAEFVGHPLADELPRDPDPAPARAALGLPGAGPVVAILPGSRRGEVDRLGPPFAATAAWLAARVPGLRVVVPAATPALRPVLAAHFATVPTGVVTRVDGQSQAAMTAADVVLLASGTATLEAMLLRRPMVVAYRLAPLTYAILRALRLVKVAYFSLPNLLAGEALVPELLQAEVRADRLGPAVLARLAESPERRALLARFDALRATLARGASDRAAAAVARLVAGRGPAEGNP
jgi:lipid-A-disaccharide synthase